MVPYVVAYDNERQKRERKGECVSSRTWFLTWITSQVDRERGEGREREKGEGECVCPLGCFFCDSLCSSLVSTSLMREAEKEGREQE